MGIVGGIAQIFGVHEGLLLSDNEVSSITQNGNDRRDPRIHDLDELAFGARNGVRNTRLPLTRATWSNWTPNSSSLSRMMNRGASPNGVAFRSCCAVHRLVGARVTPTWTTLREPCSTMKRSNTGRKKVSYVCRESHDQIWSA